MLRLLPFLLMIALGVWLYVEFARARERAGDGDVLSRPAPRPRRRDNPEVAQQVKRLRAAVRDGALTEDEAVGSLMRTCGLSEPEARQRITR